MSSPPLRPWGPPAFLFCFAAKGMRPLGEPVVFDFGGSAPGESLCGAGGPCTPRYAGAPPQVPRGVCAGRWPLRPLIWALRPKPRVTFVSRRKSPKACQGGCPLNPLRGTLRSPCGKPQPPRWGFCHRHRWSCHFEVVRAIGCAVSLGFWRGDIFCFQSVARGDWLHVWMQLLGGFGV